MSKRLPAGGLRIRPAGPGDATILFRWVNDPVVRANSFLRDLISPEEHARWFDRVIGGAETRIWIMEEDGDPAGQIRYTRTPSGAEVSISVAVEHRGHGHARQLLERTAEMACDELKVTTLVALVLPDNLRSVRAFERAGYRRIGQEERSGNVGWRFERACRVSPASGDTIPIAR